MQTLGAEKAQRDSDAFLGKKDPEMPDQPSPDPDSETMTVGESDDSLNFAPRKPAGSTMQRDQIEKQNEMLDAEAADSRDQREAMNERDAAAGD